MFGLSPFPMDKYGAVYNIDETREIFNGVKAALPEGDRLIIYPEDFRLRKLSMEALLTIRDLLNNAISALENEKAR